MPYISTEALVGAALLVVLAFGYQYIPKAGAEGKKKAKRKNKKVNGGTATSEPESTALKKGKKRKPMEQGRVEAKSRTGSGEGMESVERQGGPSLETSASSNAGPSFAAVAGGSSTSKAKPKTLAEKIAPKARKTKVDDMLAPEDLPPTHARVMKIVPSSPAVIPPASEFGGSSAPALAPPVDAKVGKFPDDYESESDDDVEEDDGWNVVQSKPKKSVSLSLSGPSSSPYSAGPSIPGGAAPLPVSTKTQRKNAKKAETKKAAKAVEEADRQRRLAMHKRDLEKEKINEIYASGKKKAAGKGTAGATIENGRLVWD